MKREIPYFIVDVFASAKYAGNQLAVFLIEEEIETVLMQKIAAEINFAETTFIYLPSVSGNCYRVRIFTPKAEIPFAGHPTLGTVHVISKHIDDSKSGNITLRLKVGDIPVQLQEDLYWMKQAQPAFGTLVDHNDIAEILEIPLSHLDQQLPVHEVSTGLPFLIVPLKNSSSLSQIEFNPKKFLTLKSKGKAEGMLVFASPGHTKEQHYASRVFVPSLGIPEDPATGSATGCLAAYLLRNSQESKPNIQFSIGQGYEMNRPSVLHVKASLENGNYSIGVGGKVFDIARGFWEIE